MTPLVSILIPAYNAGEHVAVTLRSALAQTWQHTEVIVVDDGSRDGTLEVCRRFEGPRVKVLTQRNAGAVVARNRALSNAQGAYVQWLDADDLLHPRKIELQVRRAQEIGDSRRLMSGALGTFYFRPERTHFDRTALWADLSPVDYFLARFRDNVWLQTGCWLVSRELTDAAGPWSDAGSPDDDGEYFARVVASSTGIAFVQNACAYYRVGDFSSLNNQRSTRALGALLRSKKKTIRHLLSLEDSPRTREASVHFLQELFPYFCLEPEIAEEARAFAGMLGGFLTQPPLKWKYRPARWVLGYATAMRLSQALPRARVAAERLVDRLSLPHPTRHDTGETFKLPGPPPAEKPQYRKAS